MLKRIILFLILNFSALAIGGLFTGDGVSSNWYQSLAQAPWTPPGWAFGAAWTFIMICFAIYMAFLIKSNANKRTVILLFTAQLVLNIAWNPIFFYFHFVAAGMVCISLLTLMVAYFFVKYRKDLGIKTLLLAPYLIWLITASSLNFYILLYN